MLVVLPGAKDGKLFTEVRAAAAEASGGSGKLAGLGLGHHDDNKVYVTVANWDVISQGPAGLDEFLSSQGQMR